MTRQTYKVWTPDAVVGDVVYKGVTVIIKADTASVTDGQSLAFYTRNLRGENELTDAFAPGHWASVERREADDDAAERAE